MPLCPGRNFSSCKRVRPKTESPLGYVSLRDNCLFKKTHYFIEEYIQKSIYTLFFRSSSNSWILLAKSGCRVSAAADCSVVSIAAGMTQKMIILTFLSQQLNNNTPHRVRPYKMNDISVNDSECLTRCCCWLLLFLLAGQRTRVDGHVSLWDLIRDGGL